VIVGDLDTGLNYTHPDLAPNVDFSRSVDCVTGVPDTDPAAWNDRNGHGTHTAGTIAAAANDIGIIGVAPDVKIAGIKAGNDDGYFFPEAVICGFIWAGDHDIDVTNNSYFADPWLFNCRNDAEQRAIWMAEQRAIKYAMSRGVVVVSATGNENIDLSKKNIDVISPDFPPGNEQEREVTNACVVIPVEIPGVIGVSGVGPDATKSFFSTYGVGVTDVTAPSGDSTQRPNPFGRVLSTYSHDAPPSGPTNSIKFLNDRNRIITDPPGCVDAATGVPAPGCALWAYLQGTSMASPHAAGVAALIMSAHGTNSRAVESFLQATATGQPCPPNPYEPVDGFAAICRGGPAYNGFYGHGLIDAEAAVE
jgi:subtilisin family serine protease